MPRSTVPAALAALALAAVPAHAATELTYAAHYNEDEMAPLLACFREYERLNEDMTVTYQQIPLSDFLQTLQTARIAGTMPDILSVYSVWGPALARSGMLAEPPAEMTAFVEENFEASTVDVSTIDGTIWGVPAEVSLYMLIYNKELFEEAGIESPPATWEEVIEAGEKIAKTDDLDRVTTAGYAFGPTVANATHPFRTLLFSRGLDMFSEDGTATNFDDPAAIEIVESQAELFRQGVTSSSNKWQDFAAGDVGMFIGANWFEKTLREGLGERFNDVVGVAPIPGGEDWRTYQYSFFLSVTDASPNEEAAWEFVRWLNEPQGDGRSCVGEMLITLGSLTANAADIAASEAELSDPFTKPYVDALSAGRAVGDPPIESLPAIDRMLRTEIEEVWLGRKEAAEAMADADEAARALLAR